MTYQRRQPHAGLWVAANGAILAFYERGGRRQLVRLRAPSKLDAGSGRVMAGPTALASVGAQIAVGYRDGTVELHRPGERRGAGRFAAEGAPSSAVRVLLQGPRSTLVVGFANGFVGVWDRKGGERLFGRWLHGPVAHLLLDGDRLHAISELGRSMSLPLDALGRRYCPLLRDLWREIPVIWRRGRAVAGPPPKAHPCLSAATR